jgi:SHS family lactate transporter-like MFS transporter
VVPAHINELSPNELRGFFPGMAYQLGVLFASGSAYLEARMTHHLTYAQAMGAFAATVLGIGAVVVGLGPEEHRISFSDTGGALDPAAGAGVSGV